jgi:hypothetical protein
VGSARRDLGKSSAWYRLRKWSGSASVRTERSCGAGGTSGGLDDSTTARSSEAMRRFWRSKSQ